MNQTHTFDYAYSLDSDLIIKNKTDNRLSFIYRRRLHYWLGHSRHQDNRTIFQSVIGEAIAETAFAPGTDFWRMRIPDRPPSAKEDDLCLLFRLANGITLVYTSSDEIIDRDRRWLGDHGVSVAASPLLYTNRSEFPPTFRPFRPPARFRDNWFQVRVFEKAFSQKTEEELA